MTTDLNEMKTIFTLYGINQNTSYKKGNQISLPKKRFLKQNKILRIQKEIK